MKFSARVKLIFVVALFAAVFTAGSARADFGTAKSAIEKYGLAVAEASGVKLTVTNKDATPLSKTVPDATLYLDDIDGLTIDWQAKLTVTGEVTDETDIVRFENGVFNLLTGGEIVVQTTGSNYWTSAIEGKGNTIVTVDGGTLKGDGQSLTGIGGDYGKGSVTVKSGTLSFPKGNPISAGALTVNGGTINGLVIVGKNASDTVYAYGTANMVQAFESDNTPSKLEYIVKSGAVLTLANASFLKVADASVSVLIESGGKLILNGAGPLNNYGTVTNEGTLENNSTINNYSGNTIDNQGTFDNKGTVNNASTGRIKNTGTINNAAGGTVVNQGIFDNTGGDVHNLGTFKSAQTAAEMGGNFDGGSIEPINYNPGGTGSGGGGYGDSGGCDAGFGSGIAGLLLAGLVALKARKE